MDEPNSVYTFYQLWKWRQLNSRV